MKFTRDVHPQSGLCLVLLPQDDTADHGTALAWEQLYEVIISQAIKTAGMRPHRIEKIYTTPQMIERVWRSMQEAEIIIADLTGRDPGVMYQLALAQMIWKRVVLITKDMHDVPVDLHGDRVLEYSGDAFRLVVFERQLAHTLQQVREEPKEEAMLIPLPGGRVDRVRARVISVERDCVTVVSTEDPRDRGFLYPEDCSWHKKDPDLTRRFSVGQELNGAFVVGVNNERRYSLIAVEDNPWPKLQKDFPLYQEFTGYVANVAPAGLFVEMQGNINGFIPRSTLSPGTHVERNDEIRAMPVHISAEERRLELRYVRTVVGAEPIPYRTGLRYGGEIELVRKDKGFVLVRLDEEALGLLHINAMTEAYRRRFEEDRLAPGEGVGVEIIDVRRVDNRLKIQLRDVA